MDERELQGWRSAGERRLEAQAGRAWRYQRYFDGEEDIPAILDTAERQAFRDLLREAEANWCELVVNAVAERLQVAGFRFAGGDGGEAAWDIWQSNGMDADAELLQTDALVCGSSFLLVQPSEESPSGVEMTAESPFEATVLYEPGSRRRRACGYKRFGDEYGARPTEVVILPDVIATWYPDGGPADQAPNPAGAVGLIEVAPQPRTRGWPRSELHSCIPIQDRINTTIWNRIVATDYGAFRQVWGTGVKIPRETVTSEDGTETTRAVSPYNVGANRLLLNENEAGRFGAIPGDSLAGYLGAASQDVGMMAAITQTPPYYLLGEVIANLSAEAITALEAGLVSKVRRRSLHVGEAYEEAARFGLALIGHPGAVDTRAEVVWAGFETRSLAQLADALVKMRTLGVPLEALWEKWGATQQEIGRWKTMRSAEAAEAAANAVTALGAPDAAYARFLAAGGVNTGAR